MAKIISLTRNAVLADKYGLCDDLLSKSTGLMFSANRKQSLVFKFKNEALISLHMIFVFYPIDVLFLNKNKVVVDKKENFKPFAFCKSRKKAMYAIELPEGAIKKTKTVLGDKIKF